MESEIFLSKDHNGLFVVFGGKIHVATGGNEKYNTASIMLQELDKKGESGTKHGEKWNEEKPTVHLVFNDVRSVNIIRKALDDVEKYLKNNQ